MKGWQIKVVALMLTLVMGLVLVSACAQPKPTPTPTPSPSPTAKPSPTPTPTPTATAADFYKGKTLNIVVSSRAGSAVDLVARVLGPMIDKEIGTTTVVDNKGGSAGMEGANYVYTQAKPDGLTIGMRDSASFYLNQLLGEPGVQWDVAKMNYLVNIQPESMVFFVTPGGPYQSYAAVKAGKALKFSSVSPAGWMSNVLAGTIELLGFDAKIVAGFPSSAEVVLAVSKAEAQGSAAEGNNVKRYADQGQAKAIFSTTATRNKTYPDLPSITELGVNIPKDSVALFMSSLPSGKLMFLPPGVPADRVKFLSDVMWKLVSSDAFKAEYLSKMGVTQYGDNEKATDVATKANEMIANKTLAAQLKAILDKYRPS